MKAQMIYQNIVLSLGLIFSLFVEELAVIRILTSVYGLLIIWDYYLKIRNYQKTIDKLSDLNKVNEIGKNLN